MRYEHTLGVSYTCQALAMRYGYDLDKAELAGLLHDCAKRYDGETLLSKCLARNLQVTPSEERDPSMQSSALTWPEKSMASRIRRSFRPLNAILRDAAA